MITEVNIKTKSNIGKRFTLVFLTVIVCCSCSDTSFVISQRNKNRSIDEMMSIVGDRPSTIEIRSGYAVPTLADGGAASTSRDSTVAGPSVGGPAEKTLIVGARILSIRNDSIVFTQPENDDYKRVIPLTSVSNITCLSKVPVPSIDHFLASVGHILYLPVVIPLLYCMWPLILLSAELLAVIVLPALLNACLAKLLRSKSYTWKIKL